MEQQSGKQAHVDLKSVWSLPSSERYYCPKCGLLLVKDSLPSHNGHGVVHKITDAQLERPTSLLSPIDDRKSQAVSLLPGRHMHSMIESVRRYNMCDTNSQNRHKTAKINKQTNRFKPLTSLGH